MVTFLLVITPLLTVVRNMHMQADQILKISLQDRLLSAARVLAQSVDGDAHLLLNKSEQEGSESYEKILQAMKDARDSIDTSGIIKYTYSCKMVDGKVRFVVDTTLPGDRDGDGVDDKAHLMEVYENPSPTLLRVLQKGISLVDHAPYTDRWGTFLSGYAPILDSGKKMIGAVGVDMSLEEYEFQRAGLRHVATLSALGVLFLAYLAGHGMSWYHRMLRHSVASLVSANEAAMAAERVKSDFLGAMSHELRTPLNAVLGMSEMLSQTPLENSQREMLSTVRRSGESLLSTLTSILEYTQLDARGALMPTEEVRLSRLLQEVRITHEQSIKDKSLEFRQVIEPGCPTVFTGKATFMKQVLTHLLSNAVKFTDKGSIELRVSAETDLEKGCGKLHFQMRDTGIGIARDHLPHLFDALYQVDGSTTRRHGGTGIGLALCKRLCDAIQARIWVESVEGTGSVFHVEAPVESFGNVDTTPSKLAVLWIEDVMTRKLATRVIEKTGAEATVAASLEEMLKLPSLPEAALCVIDGRSTSPSSFAVMRTLAQKAKWIVLDEAANTEKWPHADAVLGSPLKPADLRETITALS